MMVDRISVREKLAKVNTHWSPKLIGELNDCNVMVVKCRGELPWHHHDDEDEMFLVVKGTFIVRLEDKELRLGEGECAFVPRGVRHQTAADEEAHIIYLSRKGGSNTGNVIEARTVTSPERI